MCRRTAASDWSSRAITSRIVSSRRWSVVVTPTAIGAATSNYSLPISSKLTPDDKRALRALRASLLGDRAPVLKPGESEEALRQHKILASAIHRASILHASKSDNEARGWVRYMSDFFPSGRNAPSDAHILFGDWRTDLLKRGAPGLYVTVTHGQSVIHWQRDDQNRLCINLEDMWDEFETSVDNFIRHLGTTQAAGRSRSRDGTNGRWTISVRAPRASWRARP
jgi:hypothetical protein